MAKRVVKTVKRKKKKWYPIVAPKIFNNTIIGESLLYEPESAIGRTTTVNLMQLTGDIKTQGINIEFLIIGVMDNKLDTKITQYELTPTVVKRYVRRNNTRIDDSFVAKSADNTELRVKPFILTRGDVATLKEQAIRRRVKEEITNYFRKTNYDEIFNNVIKYALQKTLRDKLSKLHPIKSCEIRVLKPETRKIKKMQAATQKIQPEEAVSAEASAEDIEKTTEKKEQTDNKPEPHKKKVKKKAAPSKKSKKESKKKK
ncbi:hypothetical protein JW930_01610 [Candidatus Woesearchaeota archaeon]|nr:hypothetical protein [Candidatus Woesearchaeota archaeon]